VWVLLNGYHCAPWAPNGLHFEGESFWAPADEIVGEKRNNSNRKHEAKSKEAIYEAGYIMGYIYIFISRA
jgi:hypothetical protein